MKRICYLFFLACSITLLEAQFTADDDCLTCAVGDFLKAGWQFFMPELEPAPEMTFPKPEPEKQGTRNSLGNVNQPDIETDIVADPDKNCNSNGAAVSLPLFTLTDILCSQLFLYPT